MSAISKKLAQKVGAASVSGGGINIRHGKYLLMIKKVSVDKKFSGECFIMEMQVIEAEKIEVDEGGVAKNVEPNKAGSDCSYVVNFDGKGKASAPGNVKQILCAVFNVSEDQLTPEEFEGTFEDVVLDRADPEHPDKEVNPLRGWLIRCGTYPKEVRSEKGRFITGIKWECASPPGEGLNAPEEIAKRRKALDGVKKAAETKAEDKTEAQA